MLLLFVNLPLIISPLYSVESDLVHTGGYLGQFYLEREKIMVTSFEIYASLSKKKVSEYFCIDAEFN